MACTSQLWHVRAFVLRRRCQANANRPSSILDCTLWIVKLFYALIWHLLHQYAQLDSTDTGKGTRRRDTLQLKHDLQHFSLLCLFMASATQLWRLMCSSLVSPLCLRTRYRRRICRVPGVIRRRYGEGALQARSQWASLLSDSLYGDIWCSTVVYVILWHVLQFMVTL